MSFTYSGNPANSPLDAVRFLISDTVEADALVQDVEIVFELAQERNNTFRAAANLCETIATRLAQQPALEVGGVKVNPTRTADHYMILATRYRNSRRSRATVAFVMSGSNTSDCVTAFTRDLHSS